MDVLYFVFTFISLWYLGFYFLIIMNNASVNIIIQVFVWRYVFLGKEILGYMVDVCVSLFKKQSCFPKCTVLHTHQ